MVPNNKFTFDGVYAPRPVKWLNSLARNSKPVFDRLVSLQCEDLLEAACRKTELTDWGDPRFQEDLTALLDSVNQEGKLTFFGRFTLRQFLIENLCSRLRVIEVLKRFPEIHQQTVQRPIFITGWYRTGTTHLHSLLASHPDLRAPFFWELRHPCPTLDPRSASPRGQIRKVQTEIKIHRWLAPGFKVVHPIRAENPEECVYLFDKACTGTTAFFITEAKSFAWWLLGHEIQHAYNFFKLQLQLLNWLRPGRQWVLKWPYHLWHLETLLKTFPNATVIQLHRDPRQAIPSVCSLAAAARAPFCESMDSEALGRFWLDYCEAGLNRGFSARGNAGSVQIIDIRYPDLKENPRSVLKHIQNSINLEDSEAWTKALTAGDNQMHQSHHYTPVQFGFEADQIRERFSGYIQDYDLSACAQ